MKRMRSIEATSSIDGLSVIQRQSLRKVYDNLSKHIDLLDQLDNECTAEIDSILGPKYASNMRDDLYLLGQALGK